MASLLRGKLSERATPVADREGRLAAGNDALMHAEQALRAYAPETEKDGKAVGQSKLD